jgi:hypothetical protein
MTHPLTGVGLEAVDEECETQDGERRGLPRRERHADAAAQDEQRQRGQRHYDTHDE